MKRLVPFGIAVVASAILFVGANSAGTSTIPADALAPRPIPELEAERLAATENLGRDDCGRLSAEDLAHDRTPIETHSRNFVLEGMTTRRVELPIAGAQARVAVFSATDGQLDATLADPNGNEIALKPYSRAGEEDHTAMSRVQDGRGSATDGVVLVNDYEIAQPGLYALDLRGATAPVDIIVKDASGPDLVLWFEKQSYDARRPVTLKARVVDNGRALEGVRLVARVRGERARTWRFDETEPGVYTATMRPGALRGMPILQVEAKGATEAGIQFQRNGSIGTIVDDANAVLLTARRGGGNDSDLTVEVDVDVTAAGRYYLRANLVGSGDTPIAWAQDARDLQAGRHTLTLRFDRRLAASTGDLAITDLTLLNVTKAPGVLAPSRVAARIAL